MAGEEYVLEVRGADSGPGTLIDPELAGIYVTPTTAVHLVYEAAGRLEGKGGGRIGDNGLPSAVYNPSDLRYDATLEDLVAPEPNRKRGDAHDFDDGKGQEAWLLFRAEATGSHWLKVISQGGFAGTYVVAAATAAQAPATCASPPGMVRAEAEVLNDMMVRVSWDEPEDGGAPITGYVVEYRKKGDSQWTRHNKSAGPMARSIDIPNLEPEEEYEFQVFAQNAAGDGQRSPTAQAITLAPGEGNQPPELISPQTGLQRDENTALDVAVVASDANIEDSVEQVQVVASTPPNVFSLTGNLLNGDLRLISGGLLDHEQRPHSVTLKLTSGSGTRGLSAEVRLDVTVRDVAEPPTVPQNFEATPTTGTSVTLEWEASTTTGPQAINYAVEYRPVGDSWIAADDGPALTQTITGLTPDTDYEFRVEATNAEGASGFTRTTAHTPAAPGLVVSPTTLTVAEDGTGSFTVKLATQPTASVTVSVAVAASDVGEATVDMSSLTFTTTDWGTPQTVTVSGTADSDAADESATVNLSATSTDSEYQGKAASVAVGVTDNDEAGLVVNPATLTVAEEGSGSFTVRLATLPTASVTVSVAVAASDVGEATVDMSSLTFTTNTWDTAQTVTVSGTADVDTANESATVNLAASGGGYGAVAASVAVSVTDNDEAGLVVNPATLTVAEEGSGSFTVRLATLPTASVTVTVTSGDTTEATVDMASLTFTTNTWDTAQTVTVSGTADVDTADETVTVNLAASGGGYGAVAATVAVGVTDNDEAGLVVNPTTLTVVEEGSGSFTVRLATLPTASVTVSVAVAATDAGEATVDMASLTFTTTDWSTPQTVTVSGTADSDTANESATVNLSATSTDSEYQGKAASVAVGVTDNDTAGLVVNPATLTVAEEGSGSFTVRLATLPTATVTVSVAVAASDVGEATVDMASLTFTTTDWGTPQTVTVSGTADVDTANESATVNLSATSTDSEYQGKAASVAVGVTDNDEAGLVVNPATLTVAEEGSGSFTVRLATLPTASVTVSVVVAASDVGEATVDMASLTFTTTDWNTPQTVTVSGVADSDTADESATVNLAASGGGYGAVAATVAVGVTDNDEAGLVVSPATLTVVEEASGSFTVRLATLPTASVTVSVAVAVGDVGEVTVDMASLTFTTTDWGTPQTVTVSGTADSDTADESATVNLAASGGGYGAVAASVAVGVTDNDEAGLVVSPVTLTVVEEGSGSFTVRLATLPTASVTVSVAVASSDAGEATVDMASLTFTTNTWGTPQTVTVSGTADSDTANESATVNLSATSTDSEYAGETASVAVSVTDNDTAGLVVSPVTLTVVEEGSGSFTVRLATLPTASVTVSVAVAASDVGEATVDMASLTFTTTDWGTPQTVTVSGVADVDTANESATVNLSATSTDSEYAGETASVAVAVTDNDEAGLVVSPVTLTVAEEGSGSFTVRLATLPTASVTVSVVVAVGDVGEVTVDMSSLTFTTTDWNTPQTVTVSGTADSDTADETVTVNLTASGGGYGAVAASVAVGVTDNDEAGLVVSPETLTVVEEGSGSFTVRLATLPTASVTVSVAVAASDVGEATVDMASLTFTTTDWNTPQTVTVSGVADVDTADESATVNLSATSTDSEYQGKAASVAVGVTDNDEAGLVVNPVTLTVVEEGSGSFTVRLATLPTASVTVSVAVAASDVGEATVGHGVVDVHDEHVGHTPDRDGERHRGQ